MGLKNCPECGKLFMDNPAGLCMDCVRQEEKDSDKVADFLRDKKKANIEEIHETTGVKIKVILKMLRKGRIFGDAMVVYPCESCGEPIMEGKVCSACSKNIMGQVKPAAKPEPEPPKVKDGVFIKF